jgi:two-component system chemotaxis response regulator CheB
MTFSSSSRASSGSSDSGISVMLVDDSSVIRGSLGRILERDSDLQVVQSVHNGKVAISAAERKQPDVIILDIEMPEMDGLTALPEILKVSPKSKVIMFSSLTDKGASHTLKAFSLGAVECLLKPTSSQGVGPGSEFERHFISTIKGLFPGRKLSGTGGATSAAAAVPTVAVTPPAPGKTFALYNDAQSFKGRPDILLIGSSTGGPQALFELLKNFKNFNIPILITQHMPPKFTTILAEHIQQQTGILAQEGAEGMALQAGQIYVAPGGYHMLLKREGTSVQITLDDGPQENFCKPAVDPMFRSALSVYGQKMLAVILTGMGSDGLKGGQILVEKGVRLIAQDEASSVVWGMPGAVAKAGICSAVLPLTEIGPWVRRAVTGV